MGSCRAGASASPSSPSSSSGGFILRDRLSSNAGDLKVGDCFDEPASGDEISDVQHHPCTESHTAEVVFLGEMAGDNAHLSDRRPVRPVRGDELPAGVRRRTPADVVETEAELTLSYYVPTQEGWGKGNRQDDLLRAPGRQRSR